MSFLFYRRASIEAFVNRGLLKFASHSILCVASRNPPRLVQVSRAFPVMLFLQCFKHCPANFNYTIHTTP